MWIPAFLEKHKQICISGEFVEEEETLPVTAIRPAFCVKRGCRVCTVYFYKRLKCFSSQYPLCTQTSILQVPSYMQ